MKHSYTPFRSILFALATLLGILLLPQQIQAQLGVSSTNMTADSLAKIIAGNGVNITSATLVCPDQGAGKFTNGSTTNLGLNEGILLTSGYITNAQGPNNVANRGRQHAGAPGDADLQSLAGNTTFDACVLTFTFEPQSDLVRFNYVFGSEEYPEFVCSPYNDVFAFFISGPNPMGGSYMNQNLALVPMTSTPVAINTVNGGVVGDPTFGANRANCQPPAPSPFGNTSYYIDNNISSMSPQNMDPLRIQYDGFTTVLQAAANVVPCGQYTLKIGIADVTDRLFDSGVFLEKGSLSSDFSVLSVNGTDPADIAQTCLIDMGCGVSSRQLIVRGSNGFTWSWTADNLGTTTTLTNIIGTTTTVEATASDTVRITGVFGGCTITKKIAVHVLPSLQISCPSEGPTLACIENLPAPDINQVTILQSCGNVTVDITDVTTGTPCSGRTVMRTYLVTDIDGTKIGRASCRERV